MTVLKDFSTLASASITLRLGPQENPEEVPLPVFPAYASLKISEFTQAHPDLKEVTLLEVVPFLADTLGRLNPAITEEYLWGQCSEIQISELFAYLIQQFVAERAGQKQRNNPKN